MNAPLAVITAGGSGFTTTFATAVVQTHPFTSVMMQV
jgi:hypothetical protein